MDVLETKRLVIRPFEMSDLEEAHRVLDQDIQWGGPGRTLAYRRHKLRLYTALADWDDAGRLYGFRALTLKPGGEIIGTSGFHPDAWRPDWKAIFWPQFFGADAQAGYGSFELGIGYALARGMRGLGYATEAAGALLEHAFGDLHVARVFALTDRDNHASVALMRRLGMRVASHPDPAIAYPAFAGVCENPG
jgi:RimJ/RimL family protein N-acetyltransferase